jgi:DNA-binding IclR family transcriptional regulator
MVTWLARQREVRLSEVAALVERDEATTRARLAELAAQGFVQVLE